MAEDKLELELDVNTKDAKEKLDKLANEYTQKKIRLGVDQSEIKKLEQTMVKFQKLIDNPLNAAIKDQLAQQLQGQINKYNELTKASIACKEEIKAIRIEMSRLLKLNPNNVPIDAQKTRESANEVKNLKDQVSKLNNALNGVGSKINNGFYSLQKNILNVTRSVDQFSRRIFSLLRNAFVFNVISRGFRGLSNTLYNLIKRDSQLAISLLYVKANLIRAFAPIWQVVLPWIRALGRGLVWLSNQLIRFINFLAGKEIIKPVKEIGEAQKVVSNFMKIASPKKEMFDLKKPAKKTKKLKDNTKKAAKESNKLLASFDKLETLKFKKGGFAKDPFGLEELKKNKNGKDILDNGKANLEVEADTESVEQQIARAINQIEDQPLEFKVNDNIGEQITSEVNGLNLPTLDFKVNADNKTLDELRVKLEIIRNVLIGIISGIAIMRLLSLIGVPGLLAIIAGGLVGLLVAGKTTFSSLDEYTKNSEGELTDFGKKMETLKEKLEPIANIFDKIVEYSSKFFQYLQTDEFAKKMETLKEKLKPMTDELKKWKDELFPKIAEFVKMVYDNIKRFFTRNPEFIDDIVKVFSFILTVVRKVIEWGLPLIGEFFKMGLVQIERAYGTVKSIFEFGSKIADFVGNIFSKISEFIGTAISKISGFFSGIGNFFGGAGKFDAGLPNVLKPPGLAQGSVLNGGDPFLAYLNDQPRGQTNIEAPLDTMVTAFKQALSEGGYSGPTEINLEATGDMSQLIRFLNIKLSDERIRVGNSFVPGY